MVDVDLQNVVRGLGLHVAQLVVDNALKDARIKALEQALSGTLEGEED